MIEYASRLCPKCNIGWPLHNDAGTETDDFTSCPRCSWNTFKSTREPTVTVREAREAQFEEYLERREREDRTLIKQVEPFAFAQYLMDAAEEQIERESDAV